MKYDVQFTNQFKKDLKLAKLNFRKLSVEERKWLKKIAEKSDLLKNPKPQRGRR